MRLDRAKLDATLGLNPLGCPWCGKEDWLPAQEPTMHIREGERQLPGPGQTIVVYPVMCKHCGLTLHFDANRYSVDESGQP